MTNMSVSGERFAVDDGIDLTLFEEDCKIDNILYVLFEDCD